MTICFQLKHILCGVNILKYLAICFQQIAEEAGGVVTRMDGGEFTVFDRSVLVSNGVVHRQVCS
jgi:fructose-1,6-bisphosphatase/inositol monophosphatase family enzyme